MGGSCDDEKFHITISFGSLGKTFNIMLGTRDLTPDRSAKYGANENATHMSFAVPFLASDVAFEVWLPFVASLVTCCCVSNVSLLFS